MAVYAIGTIGPGLLAPRQKCDEQFLCESFKIYYIGLNYTIYFNVSIINGFKFIDKSSDSSIMLLFQAD